MKVTFTLDDIVKKGDASLIDRLAALKPELVTEEIARGVSQLFTEHLKKYDREHPNKMGGRRTNFVGEIAESVNYRFDPQEAVIGLSKTGTRQAIFGGEIVAKGKKLTIPAIAEAYGTTSQDSIWKGRLELLYRRKNGRVQGIALAKSESTPVGKGRPKRGGVKARKRTSGRVVFWLVEKVNQMGRKDMLPGEAEVFAVARRAIDNIIFAYND